MRCWAYFWKCIVGRRLRRLGAIQTSFGYRVERVYCVWTDKRSERQPDRKNADLKSSSSASSSYLCRLYYLSAFFLWASLRGFVRTISTTNPLCMATKMRVNERTSQHADERETPTKEERRLHVYLIEKNRDQISAVEKPAAFQVTRSRAPGGVVELKLMRRARSFIGLFV